MEGHEAMSKNNAFVAACKTPCGRGTASGGGGGIRTLDGVTPITIFETVPFNRSGTPPKRLL